LSAFFAKNINNVDVKERNHVFISAASVIEGVVKSGGLEDVQIAQLKSGIKSVRQIKIPRKMKNGS
jgi:hypothetical protein